MKNITITALACFLLCSIALNAALYLNFFAPKMTEDQQKSFQAAMNLGGMR